MNNRNQHATENRERLWKVYNNYELFIVMYYYYASCHVTNLKPLKIYK